MAVSPADFELYSRVTGRAVPRSPQERMKMAPAVNKFIKNREYERPQQTTLQKGADLLGKAALIGGALAAGHAIGGGFRGTTAEKVAEVVGNMAKTGDVGEKGGKVVKNVAKAATGMSPLSNEVYGALQQEEMLNNLAQDTVLPAKPEGSAQISLSDRGNALADRILNRPGSDLDSLDNIRGDIPQNTGGEGGPSLDSGPTPRRPHGGMSRMEKLMNQEEARADVYDEVWGKPLDNAFETAIALDDERDTRSSSIAPITPQPTEIVATTPESSEVVSNEGGLRQRVEDFGNRAEQHVKDWWHLDNEKIGYQIQGALENENPLAGAAQAAGVIVPALGKQGLLNAGQTAQGLYGYGKEFMGDYVDTVRQGYERAKDIALSDQIRRSSMGVGGGKVLGGDFSVSGSPLLYGMQKQVDQGWGRHDEAISSLQRNIQAALPTTVPTGQVAIGETAQLNRHPDVPPGETDMAPSRLIQQFSDKGLLGEGSLTPDDLEIRTDVDVRDPVNFTQLFGKRVGRGEKAKFIAGLQDRNKDVYSGASDLPKRKEGTGFKWEDGKRGTGGSAGEAATLSGAINYTSPDDRPKNPLQAGFDALREGYQEASAAEEVGRRMAEREEQESTEWVRSPDGKLRRKKIDDPWES